VFLVIENSVGGGIAIDGRLFSWGTGPRCEIGYLKVPGRDERDLERPSGWSGRWRAIGRAQTGRCRSEGILTDVRDACPVPSQSPKIGEALAFAVVQVSCLIDPDRIVLGGRWPICIHW